ncbi:MAG TPA: SDR family NAD(P)-dependent oxidoreductase [Methylomirabilota bacterium]|nr:SDR family NAD(P)-dependent oxidoreductase [Methylomirabilota bacterium]
MSGPASTRVALITGAAGGLGRALVAELRVQGWRVAAGQHRRQHHAETEDVLPVTLDVTDPAAVGVAVDAVLARWQRIDLLVHNAGVALDRACWQLGDEDWDRVLAVNLKGAFLCARAVLRPMLRQRGGHIINISSFSGRAGARGQANYAAAKAGLLGLTQSLAREVGSRNIRVNAVLPGVLPTAMTAGLPSEQMADFARANALGRINSTDEVARFVAFLATMENVSGQVFQLDSRVVPWT